MSQLLSNGVPKTVSEVLITYKRKRRANRGETSMLSDLQEAIPPKKDAGGSIVASVGEGLGRNFVNHDIPPPSKHFQISMGRQSVHNVYKRERKRKPVRLIVSPAAQGDVSALMAPEIDVDASVVMVEDVAGDFVVEEITQVYGFYDECLRNCTSWKRMEVQYQSGYHTVRVTGLQVWILF